jgi:uncharacterized protein (DUF433 family)
MSVRREELNVYRGRDPRDIPTYSTIEAAHYLRIPEQTIRNWCFGRSWSRDGSPVHIRAVIQAADAAGRMLSFVNMVELHVLDSIRRQHQVELGSVRKAVTFLKKQFDTLHPLADVQMETNGKDLFVEQLGRLINASREGQLAMKEVLEQFLSRIERDPRGLAIRLFPFTRHARLREDALTAAAPRLVSIEPTIAFGRPVIAGSRIPTVEIAERFKAGDASELLAVEYGRPIAEIEEAIRCELALDAA